jgi:hypothetical protein
MNGISGKKQDEEDPFTILAVVRDHRANGTEGASNES